jgi:hypothetical protein
VLIALKDQQIEKQEEDYEANKGRPDPEFDVQGDNLGLI